MPKRKRVESEECDGNSRCSRVTSSSETSDTGMKHYNGKIPPDGVLVLPGKREINKNFVTPEKCSPGRPRTTEGTAKSSKCTNKVRQESFVVRRSPRNKAPVSKHENCKYTLNAVLLPNGQCTSKEEAQSSDHNLWVKQHAYAKKSSRDVIPTFSEIKKKACKLLTQEIASSDELKRKTDLKSNSKNEGGSLCCREGMRRSARIKNRGSFSPKNRKTDSKKKIKARCLRCLNSVSCITGMSNNLVRESFDSKMYLTKAYSCESDAISNSHENDKEVVNGSIRKSKRQRADENRDIKSYNTRSKSGLLEKGLSYTSSKNVKVHHSSFRAKKRRCHHNTVSPQINSGKVQIPSKILVDIRNEFSDSVPQTASVKKSTSCLTERSCTPHAFENELWVELQQYALPSSSSGTTVLSYLEQQLFSSNQSLESHDIGKPGDRRSRDKSEHISSKNYVSTEIRAIETTDAEILMSTSLGAQNFLEMLDLCRRSSAFKTAFSIVSCSGESRSSATSDYNASVIGTMCRSVAALRTKRLKSLEAFAVKFCSQGRKVVKLSIHLLSGLRHRLLNEYCSSRTNHDFLVNAKEVLLRPILFTGSSDVMLEISLLGRFGETGSRVGFIESNGEMRNDRSFYTADNCERTRENSVSASLPSLTPGGNVSRRRKHRCNRTSLCLPSGSGNGFHMKRTCARKTLSKDRFGKTPQWPVTPQQRQIQITLDMCFKNRALSKLPKVKTTQELVHELFDKSRCQVPVSLERYFTLSPSGHECENAASQLPVEISSQMTELSVNPLVSLQRANPNTLELGQKDMSPGLLQLPMNEAGVVPSEKWNNLSQCSADSKVTELSTISDSSFYVDFSKQSPRKDQNGAWQVECVGGNFDCYGNWKEFTECCEKESYNGQKLLILPWICLD